MSRHVIITIMMMKIKDRRSSTENHEKERLPLAMERIIIGTSDMDAGEEKEELESRLGRVF